MLLCALNWGEWNCYKGPSVFGLGHYAPTKTWLLSLFSVTGCDRGAVYISLQILRFIYFSDSTKQGHTDDRAAFWLGTLSLSTFYTRPHDIYQHTQFPRSHIPRSFFVNTPDHFSRSCPKTTKWSYQSTPNSRIRPWSVVQSFSSSYYASASLYFH